MPASRSSRRSARSRRRPAAVDPGGRPARHLFPARAHAPTRRSPATSCWAGSPSEVAARPGRLRRRRHQPAAGAAPGARAEARRPADDAGAQHDRHRPQARHRDRRRRACRASSACRSSTSVAVRRGGIDELLRRHRPAPRRAARDGRVRLAAARRRRTCAPANARPTASCWPPSCAAGAARHADRRGSMPCCCIRSPAWSILLGHPVRHVPGGVRLGDAADGRDRGRLRTGSGDWSRRHRCPTGCCKSFFQDGADRRRRQRHRVPAADRDPVLLHPAAGGLRLHGARGVPDGPHHGRRRPARPRLHPAAVELRLRHPRHHGDARDRQPARPADHHPGRAADDLLGAHPGLHPDHRAPSSPTARSGASSACRGW